MDWPNLYETFIASCVMLLTFVSAHSFLANKAVENNLRNAPSWVAARMLAPFERKAFQRQFPEALLLIANSMQAGFSLYQALQLTATEFDAPVGRQLRQVINEVSLGKSMGDALRDWQMRAKNTDLDLTVTAIVVQRRLGGNLSEVLTRISDDIRQREQLKGKIKSLTSQGKLTGVIVGTLPLLVLYAMSMFNPEFVQPMFTTTVGKAILVAAAVLELLGCISILRICHINI